MSANEQENRSREIADTIRRYLIAINTGGIGVSFAVAGTLAGNNVKPSWVIMPVVIFSLGLTIIGVSLFLAKHKAIKRRDANINNKPEPDYTSYIWRNITWDIVSLIIFLLGVFVGVYFLYGIEIQNYCG